MIISYKPQILFDTLPTVWQIFNLLVVTLQTLSAYYKVYMSQPTHRGAEVLHGLQLQIVLTLHNADQMLLLGLINTLANMWETCLCSASTLDERIKLGHVTGVDLMLDRVSKVCCTLTMGWFSPSSWHVEEQKPAISLIWDQSHRTDPHNCLYCSWLTLVTTNGTLIWLGNQCATHQLSSLFQTNTAGLSRVSKNSMFLVCLCIYSRRHDQH